MNKSTTYLSATTDLSDELRPTLSKRVRRLKDFLRWCDVTRQAAIAYPRTRLEFLAARHRRSQLPEYRLRSRWGDTVYDPTITKYNCRVFDYDLSRLPNTYLAELEARRMDRPPDEPPYDFSIGYPAWTLLYYSILCSISGLDREAILVETGTNQGISTIVMAQALSDARVPGRVRTVDIDADVVEIARRHVRAAGLGDRVEFIVADSTTYLEGLVREVGYVDFAFLDGSHALEAVVREFEILHPAVVACKGKVYFDNISGWGVGKALAYIRRAYRGHLVEFKGCSLTPPGNAIWQPD